MTAKEMQKRNERAQQLRVIQVDEGNFFVESSDGKVAYKCLVNEDKSGCTCLDFNRNAPNDPNFRCKHLMAIENCLPEGGEKKGFLKKHQPKLDERFIKEIEGKKFALYAGLLDLAHRKGLTSMEVEILQYPTKENGYMAIVKAYAESKLGETFSDLGDANPENCNFKVAKHLLRMASTRAKARCLRDFTNVGITALEELGDLNEVLEESPKVPPGIKGTVRKLRKVGPNGNGEFDAKADDAPAPTKLTPRKGPQRVKTQENQPAQETSPEPKTISPMSEAQKRAIYNLSRRRGISVEELHKRSVEAYGTSLEHLSAIDASQFIRNLQQSA